jgi:hypothetical protein
MSVFYPLRARASQRPENFLTGTQALCLCGQRIFDPLPNIPLPNIPLPKIPLPKIPLPKIQRAASPLAAQTKSLCSVYRDRHS